MGYIKLFTNHAGVKVNILLHKYTNNHNKAEIKSFSFTLIFKFLY